MISFRQFIESNIHEIMKVYDSADENSEWYAIVQFASNVYLHSPGYPSWMQLFTRYMNYHKLHPSVFLLDILKKHTCIVPIKESMNDFPAGTSARLRIIKNEVGDEELFAKFGLKHVKINYTKDNLLEILDEKFNFAFAENNWIQECQFIQSSFCNYAKLHSDINGQATAFLQFAKNYLNDYGEKWIKEHNLEEIKLAVEKISTESFVYNFCKFIENNMEEITKEIYPYIMMIYLADYIHKYLELGASL